MKKQHHLTSTAQNNYLQGKNKSKSPLTSFRKTPPANVFSKTPPKHFPLMGITFSTKASTRTLGLAQVQQKKHNKGQVGRQMTLQMQQLCRGSDADNGDESSSTPLSTSRQEEDEYFCRSLLKVSQIRSKYNANKVTNQLKEVLNMIKEEKLKISQKMKILKKNNQYYRRLCEGDKVRITSNGTNTIDFLDLGIQPAVEEEAAQVNPEELNSVPEQPKQELVPPEKKESEVYIKLCTMLQDMDIDYRQILPEALSPCLPSLQKQYKHITDAQTIKIQQFLIGKLAFRYYNK